MTMFNCKDSIDKLLEYLDGDVTADVKQHLDAHFQGCAPCEEFLKQYRETAPMCRKALLKSKMPREFADRMSALIRDKIRSA